MSLKNSIGYVFKRASQMALVVKNPPANAGDTGDTGSIPGLRRSPPVFLSRESHEQKSLEGYSPQGGKELDTSEVTQHAGSTHMYLKVATQTIILLKFLIRPNLLFFKVKKIQETYTKKKK